MSATKAKLPPKILIIYTGGTIGMVYDDAIGAMKAIGFKEIRDNIPEIIRLGYEFEVFAFNPPIDSSNMSPQYYIQLATIIEENYNNYDGFVVLHGSDTMAFTASALSFMLENLGKPVIITGSQLPIGQIRTDARENIITALEIAAARKGSRAYIPEVCIFFDFQLFRGNRSKKYNAEKFEAFYTMNYPILAEAGISIKYHNEFILKSPGQPLKVHKKLDSSIAVLKLFPGINAHTIEAILNTKGIRAVLMETWGSGNASTETWFIDLISRAIQRGLIIINITQCDGGSVELGRYETSKYLDDIGVISGFDLTFEAAITKMMFLLGQGVSDAEFKELMQKPLRGEMTIE